jgi:hypothetical protein
MNARSGIDDNNKNKNKNNNNTRTKAIAAIPYLWQE